MEWSRKTIFSQAHNQPWNGAEQQYFYSHKTNYGMEQSNKNTFELFEHPFRLLLHSAREPLHIRLKAVSQFGIVIA